MQAFAVLCYIGISGLHNKHKKNSPSTIGVSAEYAGSSNAHSESDRLLSNGHVTLRHYSLEDERHIARSKSDMNNYNDDLDDNRTRLHALAD